MISTGSMTEQNSESSFLDANPECDTKRGRKKTDQDEYINRLKSEIKQHREEIEAC